jgi:hypothetical protein
MRNLLERSIARQAQRITSVDDTDSAVPSEEIRLLRPEDLPERGASEQDNGRYGPYI